MTHEEKRAYLINYLLSERGETAEIPNDEYTQRRLLRSLFNVRMPKPASGDFLAVQDAYLREEALRKGVTRLSDLEPVQKDLYIWQGDITTLDCDAIVNAANSQLLGCFNPCHGCIDNAIHTFSGIQLRAECHRLMSAQGHEEPTGKAKITPAYNLPCKFVLHTVGPIVSGRLTQKDCELLRSCYLSCLNLAVENGCESVAFCCISTGVFGFPKREAARIAVDTVRGFKEQTKSSIKVVFNVFKDEDLLIYKDLLQ